MEREGLFTDRCGPDEFIVKLNGQGRTEQGMIKHIRSQRVFFFHSFLEMLLFIQERLEEYRLPGDECPLRSWPLSPPPVERKEKSAENR